MAFKSNMLLRQRVPKIQTKKKPTSPIKRQIVLDNNTDMIATDDASELIELVEKNDIDEADNNVEYVTVIYENDESIEEGESKIEMLDDSSETEETRENEYIVAEVEDDEIPKISLNRHRRKRSKNDGSRSLTCPECGKVLSNPSSYKYHMQLHSDDTPFLCSDCGEGFKTRNAYDGHLVTHMEANPNKCEICGKSYRQAASLRSHMVTIHHGEKVVKKFFTHTSTVLMSYIELICFFFFFEMILAI